jgi:hypothetical protein
LAQYLAWISGVEVLIGGDFNLPVEQIQEILTKHNKLVEKSIDDVKPFFKEMGYMESGIFTLNLVVSYSKTVSFL